MNDRKLGILADWDADDEAIADVMGDAIADAIGAHERAGVSLAVWDWDRSCVAIIPPEEIVIPNDAAIDHHAEAASDRS